MAVSTAALVMVRARSDDNHMVTDSQGYLRSGRPGRLHLYIRNIRDKPGDGEGNDRSAFAHSHGRRGTLCETTRARHGRGRYGERVVWSSEAVL